MLAGHPQQHTYDARGHHPGHSRPAEYGGPPHPMHPHGAYPGPSHSDVGTLKVEVDKLSNALSDVMGAVSVLVDERKHQRIHEQQQQQRGQVGWGPQQQQQYLQQPSYAPLTITEALPAANYSVQSTRHPSMYQYSGATQEAHPDQAQADACQAIQTAIKALRGKGPGVPHEVMHAPHSPRTISPRFGRSYVSPVPPDQHAHPSGHPMDLRWASSGPPVSATPIQTPQDALVSNRTSRHRHRHLTPSRASQASTAANSYRTSTNGSVY
eukprot:TRINITY_DN13585_c0_g2_i1.p1 TRINITY_DN13585_c0_g2~~TRINITY_DN13585_c0_g2_i1.p1  ORF type:complete len:268 (+),score=45.43 TRINITY_DN13585_c0_g2_i1:76-879(+)